MRVTGDVTYHPIGVNGSWSVPLNGVRFNGTEAFPDGQAPKYAVLSTFGNVVARLPSRAYSDLVNVITTHLPPGNQTSPGSAPCNFNGTLDFQIGNTTYAVPGEEWISHGPKGRNCTLNIEQWDRD